MVLCSIVVGGQNWLIDNHQAESSVFDARQDDTEGGSKAERVEVGKSELALASYHCRGREWG